jgi:CheY-like chemotaxis protein
MTGAHVTGGAERHTPLGALIVDDEDDIRLLVRLAIQRWNRGLFVAAEVDDGETALDRIATADPAIVVLDQMMPGIDGLETATRILELRPHQPIVLFSAYLDPTIERQAADIGIARCVHKRELSSLPSILYGLLAPT